MVADVLKFAQEWAALGAALAALLVLFGGKGPLTALGRWRDAVTAALFHPLMAGSRAEKLGEAILAELKTNGGASLRDAIMRVENGQAQDRGLIRLVIAQDHSIAAFTMDHEGQCDWISLGHQKLTGRPFDEVQKTGWLSFVRDEEREHVASNWRSAVDGGYSFSTRFHVVRSDGTSILVHGIANPLTTGRGVVGWAGLLTVEEGEGWWKT